MQRRQDLIAVGAYDVPGARTCLPDAVLDTGDWSRFLLGVRDQRLTGFAVAAAEAGELPTTGEQLAELHDAHDQAMVHALCLERHLLTIHDLLGAAGVEIRVLKGTAVAHLDYAEPGLRSFGDCDILIRSADWEEALATLEQHGYHRRFPQAGEGFDRGYGKGASLVADDGYEIDAHRTLAMGPFGLTVDLDELWADPEPFELGGRVLRGLGVEQRILHACFHATVGNPLLRVQPHRDVVEMLLHGRYDLTRLVRLADSWKAGAIVARAVTSSWELFGIELEVPLLAWARERGVSDREERLLAVYAAGTSYTAKCLACLSVIPTWRQRVAYVRYLALPAPEFVGAHSSRSRLRWLARGAQKAIRYKTSAVR